MNHTKPTTTRPSVTAGAFVYGGERTAPRTVPMFRGAGQASLVFDSLHAWRLQMERDGVAIPAIVSAPLSMGIDGRAPARIPTKTLD